MTSIGPAFPASVAASDAGGLDATPGASTAAPPAVAAATPATAASPARGARTAFVRPTPPASPPAPAATATLPLSVGATSVPDRQTFEELARRDNVPGAMGIREVKFLLTGVDGPDPKLYLINTNGFAYHYDFATRGLGERISLQDFNAETYFSPSRKNLAGSILAHDAYEHADGSKGLYTMEFWPTDPVGAKHVALAYDAVTKALPFAAGKVAYHPAGETQRALAERDRAQLERLGVATVATADLFQNVTYSALNEGEGYGVLRVIDGPQDRPPSVRDVVIFKTIPNDLSHTAGVITEEPQTPLSHVNLKAKQNDTPNAYIADAANDPRIAPFIGKLVHFRVGPDGFEIREATQAEADAHFEGIRPRDPQTPPRDLGVREIQPLGALGSDATAAVGAKAANAAELQKILPAGMVPDGYAVPFHFYDTFMRETGLYEAAQRMMADPQFRADPAVRERMLADFQRRVRRADIPPALAADLRAMQARFPPGTPIRCRSSTNNEDLEGFNGAGLYDSYTHRPNEGDIDRTVKQVWASLWNFRAFEEREFYRVDHLAAAMGVLVHPNFDDEGANGVAVTKNIYDPNWPGFYVNVQVGEELVTNPEGGATPDELLISAIGPNGEYETQFIRRSNQTTDGATVLTAAQTAELTRAMETIQAHFAEVYGRADDPSFGMDIEFKIDRDGKLVIKQARPWVD